MSTDFLPIPTTLHPIEPSPLAALRQLDVPGLAAQSAQMHGSIALLELPRLVEFCAPDAAAVQAAGALVWQAQTELRQQPSASAAQGQAHGQSASPWLHLQAQAVLPLPCQRCLKPLLWPLEIERSYRFVANEQEAAEQDMESDEDLLTLETPLDLGSLLEDEALMDMPPAASHDEGDPECQIAPAAQKTLERLRAEEQGLLGLERLNPFAALAALKK
jgi:uncharacterized protein